MVIVKYVENQKNYVNVSGVEKMSKAKCFNCKITLEGVGKSMEELIDNELPLFCCDKCANEFPTDEDKKCQKMKIII